MDTVLRNSRADAENGEAQYTQVPLLEEDTNVEPPEKKIKELKKYLAHILKQKLGVNDLKEKVVIHSKSVNEHFSEQLIKDLQSLKDINDYSQLDTSLVFALLRNFCEGIKPPSRGWDYEPPDDETHVGADIERIRSMWNKYCDNDFQFKHLKDVYKRIKQKYGTVAVLGDDGIMKSSSKDEENTEGSELMKEKISSKDIFS
uniref:DZIP3-like HEPN domain-containing protein n=1 Tax=Magallana gigas TaxID=29159 RepID=A0A8W8JSU1_MAGGI